MLTTISVIIALLIILALVLVKSKKEITVKPTENIPDAGEASFKDEDLEKEVVEEPDDVSRMVPAAPTESKKQSAPKAPRRKKKTTKE